MEENVSGCFFPEHSVVHSACMNYEEHSVRFTIGLVKFFWLFHYGQPQLQIARGRRFRSQDS